MRKYHVLIVGCGPTGATLANLLRQYGYTVAIFDRDKEVFAAPRAMQIDPLTCRIFQSIGIQDRLMENDGRPALRHIFVDEDRRPLYETIAKHDTSEHGHHVGGVRFHQPTLERLLRDDFAKDKGVDAYLGYEVQSVNGDGGLATLRAKNLDTGEIEDFEADYLIGADGGGSLCRKYVSAERIDFNYSRQWIVMDMIIHDQALWDSLIDRSEFRCREDAAVVFVKGHHNHVRHDFEVSEEKARTFDREDAIALISEYFDPSSVEFQRMVPYHFYAGMPAKWRRGRVFLAGDAAHLTSPFSGQGMNMGIRDAANLAFKLDMIFKGLADDRLLDTYETERWENCEKVIKYATERGIMISTGSLRGRISRKMLFGLAKLFPQISTAASRRSSLGFPYLHGLIGDHELAGSMFFQPLMQKPDGDEILMDDLIGHRFALITASEELSSEIRNWFETTLGGLVLTLQKDFDEKNGHLRKYLKIHKASCVLLRPDRYVYDAGDSSDVLLKDPKNKLREYSCLSEGAAA